MIRDFRAKVNSGSVDLKKFKKCFRKTSKGFKAHAESLEKRNNSLDPNIGRRNKPSGYLLDKECIPPGPATYNVSMKGVWGKSSIFKYRKILRDQILNKANQALAGSKKSKRHRKKRSKKITSQLRNNRTSKLSKDRSRFEEMNQNSSINYQAASRDSKSRVNSKRKSISSRITA